MVLSLNEDSFLSEKHKPTKGRLMKTRHALLSAFGLILALGVSSVHAGKPPQIPAWYDGQIEHVIPGVSDNVVGVNNNGSSRHANPIYVVMPVSAQDVQEVNHVLGVAAPGTAGYNPWWDVVLVTVTNGRDLTAHPFTSEAEILTAALNDEVDLNDTGIILLCQVVNK
jgi:hypothetical protein